PISSLRRQGIAVALAWGASAAIAAVWLSLHPLNTIARGPVSAAVFGALSLIGAAGVLLGLARRLPGREDVARPGARWRALGGARGRVRRCAGCGGPARAGVGTSEAGRRRGDARGVQELLRPLADPRDPVGSARGEPRPARRAMATPHRRDCARARRLFAGRAVDPRELPVAERRALADGARTAPAPDRSLGGSARRVAPG